MDECVMVMRSALESLARGEVHQPLRMVVRPPKSKGLIALMPSSIAGNCPAFGFKAVCVFHDNPTLGKDAHQGAVVLVSVDTGEMLALLDASAITMIRTAATSAVATDLLARMDASELAIIGTGVQARAHLLAMALVRPIEKVRVVSRDPAHAVRFAEEMSPECTAPITPCRSAEDAVRDADIIVTATNAATPVLAGEWVAHGTHVTAVGSCLPTTRELDGELLRAARLFVDRRESVQNESGDYLMAVEEGAIGKDHIHAEIGETLIGTAEGRRSAEEITIFKSLGLSVEDLASAQYVYGKAKERAVGTTVDF